MKWSEYVAAHARLLANCKTEGEANAAIRTINNEIEQNSFTEAREKQLWSDILKKYEDEPKPFAKSISGQKLNDLQAAVLQFLKSKGGN